MEWEWNNKFREDKRLIDATVKEWKEYINLVENEEEVENIRKHTMLGRPMGTKDFMAN